jgi:osmotically-inducible protein OsmY
MTRTDLGLHATVRAALRRVLGVKADRVGVVVRDGIVTLSGSVDTAHEKLTAERAVEEVQGVHAVAEELHVVGEADMEPTDEMLAGAVLNAFQAGAKAIGRDLIVKVEHGWAAITGTVATADEQEAVEQALECIPGLRGITSEIRVRGAERTASADRVRTPGAERIARRKA